MTEQVIITVLVKRGEGKIFEEDNCLIVHTSVLPKNNMANRDIIEQVSEYFHVRKDQVKIISGFKSKKKTLKIL
jgi:hypothetical protein